EFVARAVDRRHITFGDVRRLQRDCLPGGITTREDAELLIRLDAGVDRADVAWTQWLAATIAEFVRAGCARDAPTEGGAREWLNGLLRSKAASRKTVRRIWHEIRRDARPATPADSKPEGGAPACGDLPDAVAASERPDTFVDNALAAAGAPIFIPSEASPSRTFRKPKKSTRSARTGASMAETYPIIPPVMWASGVLQNRPCFPLAMAHA